MKLHVLPTRTAGAAENMALDFLLLQRYPGEAPVARFRHYEWRTAAFTFGYSQKLEFVRSTLPPGERFDLCRRPTGGGVVDHREDWTYALVVPRGHRLEEVRAAESYRLVHEALASALMSLGQPVAVKPSCEPPLDGSCAPGPGVCFQRAELFDVINPGTGAKVAGAAQKRNKHGLLFQGSIEKSAVGALDWDEFGERFVGRLGALLQIEPEEMPWPDFHEDEVTGLVDRYSSPEWLEQK